VSKSILEFVHWHVLFFGLFLLASLKQVLQLNNVHELLRVRDVIGLPESIHSLSNSKSRSLSLSENRKLVVYTE